jgi:peptidase M23-like protein
MRTLILSLSCLLVLHGQGQQLHRSIHEETWTAEQNAREFRRLIREQNLIYIHWIKNNRGEYEFYCDNKTFSDYTVEINFTEFINLQSNTMLPATIEVPPGMNFRLFVLQKTTHGANSHFQYHHRIYKGCPSPKKDTGFAYLLPVAPGKSARISELNSLASEIGNEAPPKDYYCLSMHVQPGDTVFAARRGRVTNTQEHADLQDSSYSYSSDENYIEIEHNDCTFGKYSVFRDDAIFVHPGDWVEAGQPIGIAGGDKYVSGPQVRFSVFYHLDQDVLDKDGNSTGKTRHWAFVPLYFWTKDNGKMRLTNRSTYTADHPEELVTREMSKKEAKKWKEKHKVS